MTTAVAGDPPPQVREEARPTWLWAPGSGTPGLGALDEQSVWRLPEWVLRGISQVDFQNNWLTGLIILGGIFYNSWIYGVDCILGTSVATLTAIALSANRNTVRSGLFGFNGALLAIGVNAYFASNFTSGGSAPYWRLYVYIVIGSSLSAVVTAALMTAFRPYKMATFTWPFNLSGWVLVFAVMEFSGLHPGPLLAPALPHHVIHTGAYTGTVWYKGIGNGIAEVFFQNNWITGYVMAFALLVNTRIGALMAVGASALGVAVGVVLGAPAATIQLGLFGYNNVLTAIALGGFFFILTVRGFIWTLMATVIATIVWAFLTVAFTPVGMPAFTAPFCIVATFALLAKHQFRGLVAVAPENATYPEDNYRRWKAGADLS